MGESDVASDVMSASKPQTGDDRVYAAASEMRADGVALAY